MSECSSMSRGLGNAFLLWSLTRSSEPHCGSVLYFVAKENLRSNEPCFTGVGEGPIISTKAEVLKGAGSRVELRCLDNASSAPFASYTQADAVWALEGKKSSSIDATKLPELSEPQKRALRICDLLLERRQSLQPTLREAVISKLAESIDLPGLDGVELNFVDSSVERELFYSVYGLQVGSAEAARSIGRWLTTILSPSLDPAFTNHASAESILVTPLIDDSVLLQCVVEGHVEADALVHHQLKLFWLKENEESPPFSVVGDLSKKNALAAFAIGVCRDLLARRAAVVQRLIGTHKAWDKGIEDSVRMTGTREGIEIDFLPHKKLGLRGSVAESPPRRLPSSGGEVTVSIFLDSAQLILFGLKGIGTANRARAVAQKVAVPSVFFEARKAFNSPKPVRCVFEERVFGIAISWSNDGDSCVILRELSKEIQAIIDGFPAEPAPLMETVEVTLASGAVIEFLPTASSLAENSVAGSYPKAHGMEVQIDGGDVDLTIFGLSGFRTSDQVRAIAQEIGTQLGQVMRFRESLVEPMPDTVVVRGGDSPRTECVVGGEVLGQLDVSSKIVDELAGTPNSSDHLSFSASGSLVHTPVQEELLQFCARALGARRLFVTAVGEGTFTGNQFTLDESVSGVGLLRFRPEDFVEEYLVEPPDYIVEEPDSLLRDSANPGSLIPKPSPTRTTFEDQYRVDELETLDEPAVPRTVHEHAESRKTKSPSGAHPRLGAFKLSQGIPGETTAETKMDFSHSPETKILRTETSGCVETFFLPVDGPSRGTFSKARFPGACVSPETVSAYLPFVRDRVHALGLTLNSHFDNQFLTCVWTSPTGGGFQATRAYTEVPALSTSEDLCLTNFFFTESLLADMQAPFAHRSASGLDPAVAWEFAESISGNNLYVRSDHRGLRLVFTNSHGLSCGIAAIGIVEPIVLDRQSFLLGPSMTGMLCSANLGFVDPPIPALVRPPSWVVSGTRADLTCEFNFGLTVVRSFESSVRDSFERNPTHSLDSGCILAFQLANTLFTKV